VILRLAKWLKRLFFGDNCDKEDKERDLRALRRAKEKRKE
jgi:hypothetical protein